MSQEDIFNKFSEAFSNKILDENNNIGKYNIFHIKDTRIFAPSTVGVNF